MEDRTRSTMRALAGVGFGIALTFSAAAQVLGQTPAAHGSAEPALLRSEQQDLDGDGTLDTVAYFDSDGDGGVDSEVIDLGSTGEADIVAVRCDGDNDGREDDWVVVDAKTEVARAVLLDENDDGNVDQVAFADGRREPIGSEPIFRAVKYN